MPSPAGKRAGIAGAAGGAGSPGGVQVRSRGLAATLPGQCVSHLASWIQGFRRHEASRATSLPCGLSWVTPHLRLKGRAKQDGE